MESQDLQKEDGQIIFTNLMRVMLKNLWSHLDITNFQLSGGRMVVCVSSLEKENEFDIIHMMQMILFPSLQGLLHL